MAMKIPPTTSTRLLTLSGDDAIANINQAIAEVRATLLEGLDTATLTPLGEGGFGTTQLASFPSGARCVVKTIAKHAPTEATAIFKAEAEALKGLDHSQIPKLLGTGTAPDGLPYILQQYIPGRNLEQIFKSDGDWGLSEGKEMVRAIASILTYLHEKGLAHRDVKPQNILKNESGYYLVDFGSSKLVSDRTGTVIGSFAYAAPEQVIGKACARSDIYSLGMTAVHLLTGLNERELVDPATDEWLWVGIYEERFSDRTFLDLLKSMLERGTSKRPSAAEVMEKLSQKAIVESHTWKWDAVDRKCWENLDDLEEKDIKNRWFIIPKKLPPKGHLVWTKYNISGIEGPLTYTPEGWRIKSGNFMHQPDQWRYMTQRELEAIAPAKGKAETLQISGEGKRVNIATRLKCAAVGVGSVGQMYFAPSVIKEVGTSINHAVPGSLYPVAAILSGTSLCVGVLGLIIIVASFTGDGS